MPLDILRILRNSAGRGAGREGMGLSERVLSSLSSQAASCGFHVTGYGHADTQSASQWRARRLRAERSPAWLLQLPAQMLLMVCGQTTFTESGSENGPRKGPRRRLSDAAFALRDPDTVLRALHTQDGARGRGAHRVPLTVTDRL